MIDEKTLIKKLERNKEDLCKFLRERRKFLNANTFGHYIDRLIEYVKDLAKESEENKQDVQN